MNIGREREERTGKEHDAVKDLSSEFKILHYRVVSRWSVLQI